MKSVRLIPTCFDADTRMSLISLVVRRSIRSSRTTLAPAAILLSRSDDIRYVDTGASSRRTKGRTFIPYCPLSAVYSPYGVHTSGQVKLRLRGLGFRD